MDIGKQRLVIVRFAPEADIRQRIEHVCFVPLADTTRLRPVLKMQACQPDTIS